MVDMKALYSVCERLSDELSEANRRIEKSDKLNASDVDYIDKLTHALKSIKTVIAMEEAYDDEYSRGYHGNSYYDGGSYARGKPNMVRRDYMGKYSRDDKHLIHEMQELMNMTSDERTRREIQRLINEMDR